MNNTAVSGVKSTPGANHGLQSKSSLTSHSQGVMHNASFNGSGSHVAALVLGEGMQGLLPCRGLGRMKGGTEADELQQGLVPSSRFHSSLWLT